MDLENVPVVKVDDVLLVLFVYAGGQPQVGTRKEPLKPLVERYVGDCVLVQDRC